MFAHFELTGNSLGTVIIIKLYFIIIERNDVLEVVLFALLLNIVQQIYLLSDFNTMEYSVMYQKIWQRNVFMYAIEKQR